jgi:hypothetical protein
MPHRRPASCPLRTAAASASAPPPRATAPPARAPSSPPHVWPPPAPWWARCAFASCARCCSCAAACRCCASDAAAVASAAVTCAFRKLCRPLRRRQLHGLPHSNSNTDKSVQCWLVREPRSTRTSTGATAGGAARPRARAGARGQALSTTRPPVDRGTRDRCPVTGVSTELTNETTLCTAGLHCATKTPPEAR